MEKEEEKFIKETKQVALVVVVICWVILLWRMYS
jgi:hypothetical protein